MDAVCISPVPLFFPFYRNFFFLTLPLHGLLIPCRLFARCLHLCFIMAESCRIAENVIDAKEFSAAIEMREAKWNLLCQGLTKRCCTLVNNHKFDRYTKNCSHCRYRRFVALRRTGPTSRKGGGSAWPSFLCYLHKAVRLLILATSLRRTEHVSTRSHETLNGARTIKLQYAGRTMHHWQRLYLR